MTKEEILEKSPKGFSLRYYSADQKSYILVQETGPEEGPGLSLKVFEAEDCWRCRLSYDHLKMFFAITSMDMAFPHKDLDRHIEIMNYYAAMAERYPPF